MRSVGNQQRFQAALLHEGVEFRFHIGLPLTTPIFLRVILA